MIKNLAIALGVSTDTLIFDDAERGPDEHLKLQFEAICRLPDADKQAVKLLLEGVILKHQTKQMISNLSG